MRDDYVKDTLTTWLGYFEKLAPHQSAESDGLYFASERLTWVDFVMFDMLESDCELVNYTHLGNAESAKEPCDNLLAKFPRLHNFFNNFKTRKHLIDYFKSDRRSPYKLPYPPSNA